MLCTDMRSDKFIGTARMVSIYGRKHDVIFKYVEINSSGQKSNNCPSNKKIIIYYLLIINMRWGVRGEVANLSQSPL